MEVQTRADRVRERLAASNCDGLLVTNLVNVRYLCGFTGSNGVLWLGLEDMVLVTDRRYETQAEKEITQAQVEAKVQTWQSNGLILKILLLLEILLKMLLVFTSCG